MEASCCKTSTTTRSLRYRLNISHCPDSEALWDNRVLFYLRIPLKMLCWGGFLAQITWALSASMSHEAELFPKKQIWTRESCGHSFLALKLNRVESKVSVTLNCYLAISALQHTDVILRCICMLVANTLAFTKPTFVNTTAFPLAVAISDGWRWIQFVWHNNNFLYKVSSITCPPVSAV